MTSNYRVKFALIMGFLATVNALNVVNILANTIFEGGLIWVFNGVIAVMLAFFHAIRIDEVLNDY